jgi:hypothetical protein
MTTNIGSLSTEASVQHPSRRPGATKGSLNFMTQLPIDLRGIDPKGRPAFHLEQFRGGVIVPLDGDSILHCFPFWTGNADTGFRSSPPQPRENRACNSSKRLLGIN